jgi:hypothetical protein
VRDGGGVRQFAFVLLAASTLATAVADTPPAPEPGGTPAFVDGMIPGYRDWVLISVAREEGELNDIRAVLGNDLAVTAYREKKAFPEGAAIARLAWSLDASEENNKAFGRVQSLVAGAPKNGVQFMVKDSKKYAATGGWGYGHFIDGKPAEAAVRKSCFPCHTAVEDRDYVFTRYAP